MEKYKNIHQDKNLLIVCPAYSINNYKNIKNTLPNNTLICCIKHCPDWIKPDIFISNEWTNEFLIPTNECLKIFGCDKKNKKKYENCNDFIFTIIDDFEKNNIRNLDVDPEEIFKLDAKKFIYKWGDIMYELSIPVAIYMGFKKIYTLGWDLSTSTYYYNENDCYKQINEFCKQVLCSSHKLENILKKNYGVEIFKLNLESLVDIPYIDMFEKKYKYDYIIHTLARDEDDMIIEFITHHILLGFQHIFIYDDQSIVPISDKIKKMPMFLQKKITIIRLNEELTNEEIFKKSYIYDEILYKKFGKIKQRYIHNHFIKNYHNIAKWCMFCDIDELLHLPSNLSLKSFIEKYEEYDGIYIPWLMYGSSNILYHTEETNILNSFVMSDDYYFFEGKSIIKMSNIKYDITDPHRIIHDNLFKMKGFCDSTDHTIKTKINENDVFIAHYAIKSFTSFLERKTRHEVGYENGKLRDISFIQHFSTSYNKTKNYFMQKYNRNIESVTNIYKKSEHIQFIENSDDYVIYDSKNDEVILLYFMSIPIFSKKINDIDEIKKLKNNKNLEWVNKYEYFKDLESNKKKYLFLTSIFCQQIPNDFDFKIYKKLNNDLELFQPIDLIIHYEIDKNDKKRKYKFENIPNDFDAEIYKELNIDLQQMSNFEAKIHYNNWGHHEKRKYKYENIPDDFDVDVYKQLNLDLKNFTYQQAKNHYNNWGYLENRKYKIENDLKFEYKKKINEINEEKNFDVLPKKIFTNKNIVYVAEQYCFKKNDFVDITKILHIHIDNFFNVKQYYNLNFKNTKIIFTFENLLLFKKYKFFFQNCKPIICNYYESHKYLHCMINNKIDNIQLCKMTIITTTIFNFLNKKKLLNNEMKMMFYEKILQYSDIKMIYVKNNDNHSSLYCKFIGIIDFSLFMNVMNNNNFLHEAIENNNILFYIDDEKNIFEKYNVKINAIYFPQFHQIPENDIFWGEGFTEWTLLKPYKNDINLENHKKNIQIIKPLNDNYYALDNIETIQNQINIAKNYGINGFIIYHYWFENGHKILYKPLEFINNLNFPFCISWANETWTRRWDGLNKEVLMNQNYGEKKEWLDHIHYLLIFFKNPNYIKNENDECIFYIYIINDIFEKNAEQMFNVWYEECEKHQIKIKIIPTIGHNVENNNFATKNYTEIFNFEPMKTVSKLKPIPVKIENFDLSEKKFDVDFYLEHNHDVYEYFKNDKNIKKNVYNHFVNYGINELRLFKFNEIIYNKEKIYTYDMIVDNIILETNKKHHVGIPLTWNNCVRRKDGNFLCVIDFDTKKLQNTLITLLAKLIINHNFDKKTVKFMNVNAWNEWNEQAVLEPSNIYNFEILEIFKNVQMYI